LPYAFLIQKKEKKIIAATFKKIKMYINLSIKRWILFTVYFLIMSLMMKKQTKIVVNKTKYATNPGVIEEFF
jgi:hypothetical protein